MTSSGAPRPRVAVVGSVNVDLVFRVDRHVRPGETMLASAYAEVVGGKGYNQAVAAGRRGESHLIGAIGNDRFGTDAIEQAERRGVLTGELTRTGTPTGRAFISVSPGGENSIVVAPLANRELTPEQVRTALERIRPIAVLAQLETPMDAVLAAARWCASNGGRFILNPSPVAAMPIELIAAADPLIVNEGESVAILEQLRPGGDVDVADHRAAADALAGFVRSAVVTAGARGATYAASTSRGHVPATTVESVVDTAGAGDEFAGTLTTALAGGMPIDAAVRRASHAASALVATSRSDR
ncbi:ribokinase [Glycomyces xiaoerkulensis]|uniref:ribokinase n=1 Tax=Glycomyces xiaoerkulensis TaxID=2038139 RepID=UPI000C26096D|nr:ribokinase [Glycomyces xiaoerkulensis]